MKRLVSLVVAAPGLSIALAIALTAAFVTQIPKLTVNVSPRLLMVGDDPAVQFYEETKTRFGRDELTMIVFNAPDVFVSEVLNSIARISDNVRDLPEVVRVESLATVNNIRADGDFVSTGPLVRGADLNKSEDIARIRKDALRNPILVGKIVADDARCTAVLVYSESDSDDLDFSKRFSAEIDELIAGETNRTGLEIYQVGRPYRQAVQGLTLIADQVTIWPYGGLVILLVLIVVFRSPVAVLIPIVARLVTIVWAVGLMAAFGYPISMLSAMIPLLLISVGITEDVHIVSEFRHRIADGSDKREAIAMALETIATPLLVTSFTTGVGFASLSLSRITILHQLGVIAALGFVASFVVTILVVPALLRFAPTPRVSSEHDDARPGVVLSALLAISSLALRRRRLLFGTTAALFVLSAAGLPRITVDNDIMGFFREGSEIRRRVQDIHENLAGIQIFYIVVDTGEESGALEPDVLERIAGLQTFLAGVDKVDETLTITDFLMTVNREMHGGGQEHLVLPDSASLGAQYLVLLHPGDIDRYIDYNNSAANILVRHNITSTNEISQLIDTIERYADEHMGSLEVTLTSETILTTRAADELSASMVTGMGFTIVIVALVCALFFMSMRAALLSLVPNLLPIAVVFGVVGWLGIPVSVGIAMVAAIAIGIAVDDTVHYMSRNSLELDRHHDPERAMIATVIAEGRVIAATSFALAGGFLVFTLSSFVPLAYFGLLSAITMVIALACDLTLTPALMASTRLVTLWNVVGMKLGGDICTIAPLFKGLTRWEARKVVLLGAIRESSAGSPVVRQGDEEDTRRMYLVLSGQLRVCPTGGDGNQVLANLGPGAVFGEMSIVDGLERSADVIADTDSEVLVLSADDLLGLERRFPRTALKLHRNLTTILTERLRITTTSLVASSSAS
jgi:predicted RND superfamily exporter protein